MKTLIKNATVVLPDETQSVDVLLEGHLIADIDPAPQVQVDTVIDVGSATPMAYETWISQRSARPAATIFFAT